MILLDTHVLIWSLQDEPRLGAKARELLDKHILADALMVSAITPWEIALLAKRSRIALGIGTGRWIEEALALPGMILAELDPEIAIDSVNLPGDFHNDPADRIIIATARHHKVPLMTADRAILDYGATGHVSIINAND